MTYTPSFIFALIGGYLIGAIPFGLIFTHFFCKKNIRTIGSGNIGATNVLRTGRKDIAFLTLSCDILKGTLPTLIAGYFHPFYAYGVGVATIVGHIFPIWLWFSGGKGVATAFGVIFVFSPLMTFITFCVWLTIAALTRYSSLASLISLGACPFIYYFMFPSDIGFLNAKFFFLIWLLIVSRHLKNILSLLKGKERKIGQKHDSTP